MIRPCTTEEFLEILEIINDSADAYRGVIPADRWQVPYMDSVELAMDIQKGIHFSGYEENGRLQGVMGIQPLEDVTLIRHAYVRTAERGRGIGGELLRHLLLSAKPPVMVGTWSAASWAVRFYEKHGFRRVSPGENADLQYRYWKVPQRQVEESLVLRLPWPGGASKSPRPKSADDERE